MDSDERNMLNLDDSNSVYTTEGHPLTLPKHLSRLPSASVDKQQIDDRICPIYDPTNSPYHWSALTPSVDARTDAHYVRLLAGLPVGTNEDLDSGYASIYGFCEKPDMDSEVCSCLRISYLVSSL